MTLKDLFAKYRFPENKLDQLTITFIHRGAPKDEKTISAKNIKVGKGHFEYFDGVEWTYIPFHRILRIKDRNKVIYRKTSP